MEMNILAPMIGIADEMGRQSRAAVRRAMTCVTISTRLPRLSLAAKSDSTCRPVR